MNKTKSIFSITNGKTELGDPIFSVIVKRSYQIQHGKILQRVEQDSELRLIDHYYDHGDPDWSTVQYESEIVAYKPLIDFVVIGKAYAPAGKQTERMLASVQVASQKKSLAIWGDRVCHFRENKSPVFSDPLPFTEMEIRYDRAYGGLDDKSDPNIPLYYPRNYRGTGFVMRNVKEAIEGLAVPNIEDPDDLLTEERLIIEEPNRWHLQPLPQGFGWFQKNWFPRSAFAGSYPPFIEVGTELIEEKIGLLPQNYVALAKQFKLPSFHPRFNNGASIGLTLKEVKGDEPVRLQGLTPDGLLEFFLPNETPKISLDLGTGEQQLLARLQTISIRPDDLEVDLIWRGTRGYPGYNWLPKMKRLHAEVQ